ncbi:hypothetical protein B296_00008276 [Ensete ventricosum]|uniref:Uncharacterized protein n=1 Tax=Ensete ventricosum TaxID=4639 RepID=A0A427AUQ1_ENSVE|nr:hypothetical protein B296_00008276 [Ensete ventricosum]
MVGGRTHKRGRVIGDTRRLRRRIQAVAPAGRSLRRGKLESPPTPLLLPALSFSARIGICFLFVLCFLYLSRFDPLAKLLDLVLLEVFFFGR